MSIKKISIYGTGLIGAGWITHLLIKGVKDIVAFDLNDDCIKRGLGILEQNMSFLVEQDVITEDKKNQLIGLVRTTTDIHEAVAEADLIIENGPEVLEIKQHIIANIEAECRDNAIITTSTSGLLIRKIVESAKKPERILGAHPYHPVYLLPLLEMVRSEKTSQESINMATQFFKSMDKKPVLLKKESDGYIGSRLMTTLLRESVSMIENGVCTMEDIDDAFTYGPGFRYALFGIFTTLQLGGGEGGFEGMMCGPIGASTDKWLAGFANWHEWPKKPEEFFKGYQKEVNKMLANRDELHGRNNEEIQKFRDESLVKILQLHGML